jgi:hypothetical protein
VQLRGDTKSVYCAFTDAWKQEDFTFVAERAVQEFADEGVTIIADDLEFLSVTSTEEKSMDLQIWGDPESEDPTTIRGRRWIARNARLDDLRSTLTSMMKTKSEIGPTDKVLAFSSDGPTRQKQIRALLLKLTELRSPLHIDGE